MKKVRLLYFVLVLTLAFVATACDRASSDQEEKAGGFVAQDIAFHSEYEGYYGYEEAEPYLQAYFKSVETACHQVLEGDADTFSLSEAGQTAQKKLDSLRKIGDAATENGDRDTRLGFLKLFQPYLSVRSQELTANLAISMGNPPEDSCQALLDVLNEAHATYAAAP